MSELNSHKYIISMIRKLFFVGAAAVFALAFTSCKNSENAQSQEQGTLEEVTADAPLLDAELEGTFEGTIPGADNGGCKYTVVFGADGVCTVTRSYQKEGIEPETVTGTFEYNLSNVPNVVCKFENDAPICFSREAKDEILMVDEQGNAPELRQDYILKRVVAQ